MEGNKSHPSYKTTYLFSFARQSHPYGHYFRHDSMTSVCLMYPMSPCVRVCVSAATAGVRLGSGEHTAALAGPTLPSTPT